jgi:hypothetical protein
VIVALTSSSFNLSNEEDAGMLDVAGFDLNTPRVIRNFIVDDL